MRFNQRVILRADGSTNIGYGHVMRLLALADMLNNLFECCFAISAPNDFLSTSIQRSGIKIISTTPPLDHNEFVHHLTRNDIVVMDGYHFTPQYQQSIIQHGCKLVCIDDLHDRHYFADAVINHAPGLKETDFSIEPETRLFIGTQYTLINKLYFEPSVVRIKEQGIFLCLGGADPNLISLKVLEHLESLKYTGSVLLVGNEDPSRVELIEKKAAGYSFKTEVRKSLSQREMADAIQHCEIAIVPSSTLLYEVVALRKPVISGWLVENQSKVYAGFLDAGAIAGAEDFNFTAFQAAYNHLKSAETRQRILESQAHLIDGVSPDRLRKIFVSLYLDKNLVMRKATQNDMMTYFNWTNDPEVRENSINSGIVQLETHARWFESRLHHADFRLYIFEADNVPVGQVRLQRDRNFWTINYSVAKHFRGMGAGNSMIRMALDSEELKNASFRALVKPGNLSSGKIFTKNGFCLTGSETINHQTLQVYTYDKQGIK